MGAFEDRMARALTEDYSPPRAAATLLTKDVGLAMALAASVEHQTPLGDAALAQLRLRKPSRAWLRHPTPRRCRRHQDLPGLTLARRKHTPCRSRNAVVFITGANRGIGLAFARELLARGARKVYAAARDPASVTLAGVVPIRLDVTNAEHIAAVASQCRDVTLLINNAGIANTGGFLADKGNRIEGPAPFRDQLLRHVAPERRRSRRCWPPMAAAPLSTCCRWRAG